MTEVTVSGAGVLSPLGVGKEAYWDSLTRGTVGFKPIDLFDTCHLEVHIAGQVSDFDPASLLGRKGLRTLDRTAQLITCAARLAIDDSRFGISHTNAHRVGVSVGTTLGNLHSIFQFERERLIEGPRYVHPSLFPNTTLNSAASHMAIHLGAEGFNSTVATGFCAGLDAISYAVDFIRLGRVDVVLAGAVEALSEEILLGFLNVGYLSGGNGSEPLCCPFDARRCGTILSEGAGILVLEDSEHAARRGASALARIVGCGNSFDPSYGGRYNSRGKGLRRAILAAMADGGSAPSDIDYIVASANATKRLDLMETVAIKEVFGDRAFHVPVSAVKSMTGESYSASGLFLLTAAVGALKRKVVFPTMSYHEKDPLCDLDYVPGGAREKDVRTVLVISSDPYGHNSAVILRRSE